VRSLRTGTSQPAMRLTPATHGPAHHQYGGSNAHQPGSNKATDPNARARAVNIKLLRSPIWEHKSRDCMRCPAAYYNGRLCPQFLSDTGPTTRPPMLRPPAIAAARLRGGVSLSPAQNLQGGGKNTTGYLRRPLHEGHLSGPQAHVTTLTWGVFTSLPRRKRPTPPKGRDKRGVGPHLHHQQRSAGPPTPSAWIPNGRLGGFF